MAQERKIGVFVCHCGGNISDYVDVERVRQAVAAEPGVVVARTQLFACSDAAQQEMIDDIKHAKLDGLVVASCAPSLHLHTFRSMASRAGLKSERSSRTVTDRTARAKRADGPILKWVMSSDDRGG